MAVLRQVVLDFAANLRRQRPLDDIHVGHLDGLHLYDSVQRPRTPFRTIRIRVTCQQRMGGCPQPTAIELAASMPCPVLVAPLRLGLSRSRGLRDCRGFGMAIVHTQGEGEMRLGESSARYAVVTPTPLTWCLEQGHARDACSTHTGAGMR